MWLITLWDYFKVKRFSVVLMNALVSGIATYFVFHVPKNIAFYNLIEQFVNNSTSVLSILIGFTVAMFTLLVTASNKNIDEIKVRETDYTINNKRVTILQMLLIHNMYIILIESILLLFNLLYPFLFDSTTLFGKFFFGVDVFLMTHIILVNIGSTLNLYFVVTK